jgi:hypothetical protein
MENRCLLCHISAAVYSGIYLRYFFERKKRKKTEKCLELPDLARKLIRENSLIIFSRPPAGGFIFYFLMLLSYYLKPIYFK